MHVKTKGVWGHASPGNFKFRSSEIDSGAFWVKNGFYMV